MQLRVEMYVRILEGLNREWEGDATSIRSGMEFPFPPFAYRYEVYFFSNARAVRQMIQVGVCMEKGKIPEIWIIK